MATGLLIVLIKAVSKPVKPKTFPSLASFNPLQRSDWHCDQIAIPMRKNEENAEGARCWASFQYVTCLIPSCGLLLGGPRVVRASRTYNGDLAGSLTAWVEHRWSFTQGGDSTAKDFTSGELKTSQ